ncbi:hypothetical protein TEA_002572 [Camellia sinensis var. sinensis]|uniref:GDSL esterase/lipase n=1 Tax=Camellia sinensis var. sinensis TaxID=542762 RepID=A0A4S4DJ82_CAMSN|nr:hypothetical protein TEA_002572 [Camellia sinensis var. sinensis]
MDLHLKIWFIVSLIPLVANLQHSVHATPEVPCLFIFGDSLADNGNNNYLSTIAKANYQPYGIDFSDGPTGRFCNGRTMSDIIGQRLGFDHFIPPFATARGRDILMGVNYASGGGGIRDETGMQLTLHKVGGYKIVTMGLGLIGCTPAEIAIYGTNGSTCVDTINNDVQLFNVKLKSLVDDLNNDMTDAKFTYVNVSGITSGGTFTAGLTVTNVPCCIVSSSTGLCVPNRVPCSNRSTYAFYDAFHSTESVNEFVAARAYNAQTTFDAYPIDIHGLAGL